MTEKASDPVEAPKVASKRFMMPPGWDGSKVTQKTKDLLAGMNRSQRRAWAKKAENRKGL